MTPPNTAQTSLHRLARSLFLYALCNGWVQEGTTIVEASSGSTAVSEAYFTDWRGDNNIAHSMFSPMARERHPVPRWVMVGTGTNLIGMLTLSQEMRARGELGSILSLLCDAGERYLPIDHYAESGSGSLGDCTEAAARARAALV